MYLNPACGVISSTQYFLHIPHFERRNWTFLTSSSLSLVRFRAENVRSLLLLITKTESEMMKNYELDIGLWFFWALKIVSANGLSKINIGVFICDNACTRDFVFGAQLSWHIMYIMTLCLWWRWRTEQRKLPIKTPHNFQQQIIGEWEGLAVPWRIRDKLLRSNFMRMTLFSSEFPASQNRELRGWMKKMRNSESESKNDKWNSRSWTIKHRFCRQWRNMPHVSQR
jgi:hypothetical protein